MGIAWFSVVMISANLVALGDSDYRRIAVAARWLIVWPRVRQARPELAAHG